MRTVDRIRVHGEIQRVFEVSSNVERWPEFLPHYRWVKMIERRNGGGVVEMAAWRPFGFLKYPTWWISEMEVFRDQRRVCYRHLRGITAGMEVEWNLVERDGMVDITILHEWTGPRWPLIGQLAANLVIGPVFIHGIASRTLQGVKRETELV
jgi:ribosome-associated toxin RatA of RatAB toxin-antitoxin module